MNARPQFVDEVWHSLACQYDVLVTENGNCVEDGLICFVLVCVVCWQYGEA